MKPRHALALAFVGWYLMAPPCTKRDPHGNPLADLRASMSQWSYYSEKYTSESSPFERPIPMKFATLRDCEAKRKQL